MTERVPERVLTHREVTHYAKACGLPYFRGVFMREQLPARPRRRESGVINLDDVRGEGTHYVAYVKRGTHVRYFDSFDSHRRGRSYATSDPT